MNNKKIFLVVCMPLCVHASWFSYDRAAAAGNKGDWQKAQELLQPVVVDNPTRPDVLYDAGVVAFNVGNHEQAAAYFEKVTQHETAELVLKEQAHVNAGNAMVKLNKLHDALKQYDNALRINAENQVAKHNKEVVKKMLEQQKQEQQDQPDNQQEPQEKQDQQNKKDEQGDKKSGDQKKQQQEERKDKSGEQQDQQQGEQQKDGQQDSQDGKGGKQEQQQKPGQQQKKSDTGKDQREQGKGSQESEDQNKREEQQSCDQDNNGNNGAKKDELEQQQKKAADDAQQKKEQEQKKAAEKKAAQEQQAKQDGKQQQVAQAGKGPHEKQDWVSVLLEDVEHKDAKSNKQMLKALMGKQGSDEQNQNAW